MYELIYSDHALYGVRIPVSGLTIKYISNNFGQRTAFSIVPHTAWSKFSGPCELVIQDQLKVHNGANTVLNKPRCSVFVRPGPAPEDMRRYHAEVSDTRAGVVPTGPGGRLLFHRCTTAHEEQEQERDGEGAPVRGA